jgi:hypothetical protein
MAFGRLWHKRRGMSGFSGLLFTALVDCRMARVEGDQMGLNIKNEETQRLVRELAMLTGENMTTAVTQAVRERLERVRPTTR